MTKYGKYMCTQPQLFFGPQQPRNKKSPEFLILRTARNATKTKVVQSSEEEPEEKNFKLLPKEWERLQVSSCFLEEM